MSTFGRLSIALLLASSLIGCATGPVSFQRDDCVSGAEPGSCEWWSERAMDPPGSRQKCYKGKNWPVRPRPSGEKQQFTHSYHSAHYWPLPYVCQDRQYVRDIIGIQESNGWQQQTTVYHRHFDEDGLLTKPGELHLLDILEITPDAYRTVYVQASANPEVDNLRISTVQQTIAQLSGGTENIPVVTRRGRDYSRPASEVKMINDLYDASIPSPRLTGSGGGGGGGGAAAAGAALSGR